MPVSVSAFVPCLTKLPGAAETLPPKLTLSEREKASVPLLIATFPAILPDVPPPPIFNVPPLIVVPPP